MRRVRITRVINEWVLVKPIDWAGKETRINADQFRRRYYMLFAVLM